MIRTAGPSGRGPASAPAHDAAAAPSTVIPSSAVSSAWAVRRASSSTSRMLVDPAGHQPRRLPGSRPGRRSRRRRSRRRACRSRRPARQQRVIAGAPSAWIPTTRHSGWACRSHAPTPLIRAPLPTGTNATAGEGRSPASTPSVSSRAMVAGTGRDPRVLAVDEQVRPRLGCVGVGRGPRGIEVVADLDHVGAEGLHPGDLARVRHARGEHDGRDAQRCGRRRRPPGRSCRPRRRRSARSGPIRRSAASAWTTRDVPRPLNERIGLTVSTLTMTGTPSRADRPSWTNCGPPRNTGSIASRAARMAAGSSSGMAIIGGPSAWTRSCHA